MLWFPENLPPVPVFLGNSTWGTRCCPNMVLTWVGISASFYATSTLVAQKPPKPSWLEKNHLYLLCSNKCRTTDDQSLGSRALWKTSSDSITALLMFSSLHSYKPITSLSHVPLTIPRGVFKFPFLLCFVSVHLPVASTEASWWKKPREKKELRTHCFNFSEVTVIRTKNKKNQRSTAVKLGWQHSWRNQLGLVVESQQI